LLSWLGNYKRVLKRVFHFSVDSKGGRKKEGVELGAVMFDDKDNSGIIRAILERGKKKKRQ